MTKKIVVEAQTSERYNKKVGAEHAFSVLLHLNRINIWIWTTTTTTNFSTTKKNKKKRNYRLSSSSSRQ